MDGDLTDGIRKGAFAYYRQLVQKYFGARIPISVTRAEKRTMPGGKNRFRSSNRQKNAVFFNFFEFQG